MADKPQPARGEQFRRAVRAALAARARARRNQRGRHPAPQVTGVRVDPRRQP